MFSRVSYAGGATVDTGIPSGSRPDYSTIAVGAFCGLKKGVFEFFKPEILSTRIVGVAAPGEHSTS